MSDIGSHSHDVFCAESHEKICNLELEVAQLQFALEARDSLDIQDDCVRAENRLLRGNIDDLCKLMREIRSGRDWNGSLSVMAKRIDAALIAYEDREACQECSGTGLADSGGVQPWGEQILISCDCEMRNRLE